MKKAILCVHIYFFVFHQIYQISAAEYPTRTGIDDKKLSVELYATCYKETTFHNSHQNKYKVFKNK